MTDQITQMRELTVNDVEAVSFVNVTSYLETDKRSTKEQTNFDVKTHMSSNMMRWRPILEAIENGTSNDRMLGIFNDACQLQGFIRYGVNEKDPQKAEIHALYVAPDSWGQGSGTKMFEEAARDLQEQGFDKLMVRTFRDDPIPNGFYRKMGFDLAPLFKRISGSSTVVYEMDLNDLDI